MDYENANDIFITINAFNKFHGIKPFKIGSILKLVKEPENNYDCEAIAVELRYAGKSGYVANSVNKAANIYGDKKAEFIDFGIYDEKGNPATVLVKGEKFTIKEKIKMNETIKNPIFTWTIKDKRGTELTGTNTMLEKIDTGVGEKGKIYDIEFTQKMLLQGGEY